MFSNHSMTPEYVDNLTKDYINTIADAYKSNSSYVYKKVHAYNVQINDRRVNLIEDHHHFRAARPQCTSSNFTFMESTYVVLW